jgi:hypothetical protein
MALGGDARGQSNAGQLRPLVTPKGSKGVGHQQALEGDQAAHHPEAHGADEEKQGEGDNREPPEPGGHAAGIRLALEMALGVAVAGGRNLE